MRSKGSVLCAAVLLSLIGARSAAAQSFEVGAHVAAAQWSEFDGTDLGIGGRLTWKPTPLVGVDADLTWYPGEFPSDGALFSDNRFEGLFGVTVGPRINRIRPFAKIAAGFLQSAGTQERIICIAIFPPPLNCLMAADQTLAAFEIGGGVELAATTRTFVRVDVSDRILQYPGPSFSTPSFTDQRFELHDDAFYGHALRFTVGGGIRF